MDHQARTTAGEQRDAFYWVSVSRQIEVLAAIGEGRFADAESSALLALEAGRRVQEDKAMAPTAC